MFLKQKINSSDAVLYDQNLSSKIGDELILGLVYPEYIEKRLKKSINQWQIEDCNTPTYSPQSNGMCEPFNGTFKRDYVYESCLDNPDVVYEQIQKRVDEYNKFAPHSALDMKTPNEFFNFITAA